MSKTNSGHLRWIYERMVSVHKENPDADYMIRFRNIITQAQKDEVNNYPTVEHIDSPKK